MLLLVLAALAWHLLGVAPRSAMAQCPECEKCCYCEHCYGTPFEGYVSFLWCCLEEPSEKGGPSADCGNMSVQCWLEGSIECFFGNPACVTDFAIVQAMLCAYSEMCPGASCEDLLSAAAGAMCRELTGAEKAAIKECSGCEDETIGVPSPTDPIDQPGGEGDTTPPGGDDDGGDDGSNEDDEDDCPTDDNDSDGDAGGSNMSKMPPLDKGGNKPPKGPKYHTMPHPYTGKPVDVARGHKLEFAKDLVVRLTGPDFHLRRQYTSRHDPDANWLVGEGWTMNTFQFINQSGSGTGREMTLYGWPARHSLTYKYASGLSRWTAGGPTTQYMEESTVSYDGLTYDTWRIVEPGAWAVDFFRLGGSNQPPAELEGLIAQQEDLYGNRHLYQYTLYGPVNSKEARLTRIYLNVGSIPGQSTVDRSSEAVLHFAWHLTGSSSPINGMLDVAWVTRYGERGAEILQYADYVYKAELPMASTDLGSGGDLVQVIRGSHVDRIWDGTDPVTTVAPFRTRHVQYRYHDGSAPASGTGDERLETAGGTHQLKMVIYPEQLEYYAQVYSQGSGVIEPDPEYVLAWAADRLMTLDDDDDAFDETGGSPTRAVIDMAGKLVSYHQSGADEGRVETQYAQTSCGCAGATQGVRYGYEYFSWTNGTTCKVTETPYDEGSGTYATARRYEYYDAEFLGGAAAPYLVTAAIVDAADTAKKWVWRTVYDGDRRQRRMLSPAAMSSYTPATSVAAPTYSAHSGQGLVWAMDYTGGHRLTEVRVREGDSDTLSDFALVSRMSYEGVTNNTLALDYLPTKLELFRTGDSDSSAPIDVQTTWFQYGFHAQDSGKIAWIRTISEAEQVGENGPASTGVTAPDTSTVAYDRYELFDSRGRHTWTRLEDRALIWRQHDPKTGVVTSVTRNASSVPSGTFYPSLSTTNWGQLDNSTPIPGGELTSTYGVDLLGRIVRRTVPGNDGNGELSSYIRRELRLDETQERKGLYYFTRVRLPHSEGTAFSGPARLSFTTAGGRVFRTSGIALSYNVNYPPNGADYTFAGELSRSATTHTLTGLASSKRRWHDLSSNAFYQSTYVYDSLGRLESVTNDNGTITKNHERDVLDRVLEVKVGTTAGNLQTVAKYFYDHTGTESSPVQGVGNGNLTLVQRFTGEAGSGPGLGASTRITVREFDFRDRPQMTKGPLPPYEWVEYDNLGRGIKRGLFTTVPTKLDGGINSPDRVLYADTAYSQRGLAYRQRVAIDPAEETLSFLETHSWFDQNGRAVGVWGPNAPATKTTFDGHGRPTTVFTTDRRSDALPGATGNHANVYNAAQHQADVTNDYVVQQVDYTYFGFGGVDRITTRLRGADAGSYVGRLNENSLVSPRTYVGFVYDEFGRQTAVVNYGTNTTADEFKAGGTEPAALTWLGTIQPEWIVTQTAYDSSRGLVETVTDPKGNVTKYFYDDLSRRTAIAENFEDAGISWNATAMRWDASDVGGTGNATDVDRVTSFAYDGSGNVVKQTAHLPGGGVQVTHYIYNYFDAYGTNTVGSAATLTDSLVASNDLLYQVRYPDKTGGEPGTTAADRVSYAYGRTGELRSTTDQSTTRHVYHRDDAGRVTQDYVDNFGANIDQFVRSIHAEYDDSGRLKYVRSKNSTPTVVDEVRFDYTTLWQVQRVLQDPDGALDLISDDPNPAGNTTAVGYVYDTEPVGTVHTAPGNYSRLATMVYPEGTDLDYGYGPGGDLDDRISRLVKMTLDSVGVVEYTYLGGSTAAKVDYPEIEVLLDRTYLPTGQRDQQGRYPGWDRHMRTVRHAWIDDNMASTGGTPALPTRPSIVELAYAYDLNSNRTAAYDDRPGAGAGGVADRDFTYDYDGLDRLVEATRGAWNGTAIANPATGESQKWALDMLGNWTTWNRDLNKDGDYLDAGETEDRLHNKVNELTSRDPDGSGGASPLPFAYDDAGNMRTRATSTTHHTIYTHDAWNRLVKVETGPITPGTNTTVQTDRYNGLHWRVESVAGNKTTTRTYAASWQLLQEDVEIVYSPEPFLEVAYQRFQNVWGARYIDDMVLRRLDNGPDGEEDGRWYYLTDAQFSVRAVLDDAAKLIERVRYSAYGVARHSWRGDIDGDGASTISDRNVIWGKSGLDIGDSGYSPDCDLDRSGTINFTDVSLWTADGQKSALPAGWVSDVGAFAAGPRSPVGYCGYLFNAATQLYTVRFRTYDPGLGRWLQRDPAGFIGGMNLYGYVASNPIGLLDPLGLISQDPPDSGTPTTEPDIWFTWMDRHGKFSATGKAQLEEAAKEACKLAQCALDALNDDAVMDHYWNRGGPGGRPLTPNPSVRDVDHVKLQKQLEKFIKRACQSGRANGDWIFKPVKEKKSDGSPNEPYTRPLLDGIIRIPVNPQGDIPPFGTGRTRELPAILLHERFHIVNNTYDTGKHSQHSIDDVIQLLCAAKKACGAQETEQK